MSLVVAYFRAISIIYGSKFTSVSRRRLNDSYS